MDGDCDALLRFALATFALKQQAAGVRAASGSPPAADGGEEEDVDETLAALSECLDFLRAARGSDESDREKEVAHVAQLLSNVLGDDARRAQLVVTLVDALTSRALEEEEEDEEDALLVESVAQVIVYVCYASLTCNDEGDVTLPSDVCVEVCMALAAALEETPEDNERKQLVARVLEEVHAMLSVGST